MKIKIILFSTIGVIAILFLIGCVIMTFFQEKLVSIAINQQVRKMASQDEQNDELLNDKESIRIYTVGTASPIPGERVQTGTALMVNGHFFMFDVGDGVVRKAENMGLPLNRLDGIFITHWHSDHMMDLPSLISRSWLLGRTNELHLYVPDGTDTLNQAINQFLHL